MFQLSYSEWQSVETHIDSEGNWIGVGAFKALGIDLHPDAIRTIEPTVTAEGRGLLIGIASANGALVSKMHDTHKASSDGHLPVDLKSDLNWQGGATTRSVTAFMI